MRVTYLVHMSTDSCAFDRLHRIQQSRFEARPSDVQPPLSVQATRPGSAQQKVQLYQGPLVWSVSKTSNSWKGCHYADRGHWDSAARKCILWRFLSNLCVKLELDAVTGVWRTNKRFGDVGCNVFQQYHPVGTQRLPVTNWRVSTPPSITIEQVRLVTT